MLTRRSIIWLTACIVMAFAVSSTVDPDIKNTLSEPACPVIETSCPNLISIEITEPEPVNLPVAELTIHYPYLDRDLYVYIPSCVPKDHANLILYNHGNSGGKSIHNFYKGGFAFIKRDLERLCREEQESYGVVAPILGEYWWHDEKLMRQIEWHDIDYLESFVAQQMPDRFSNTPDIRGVANHSGGWRWFDNVGFMLEEFDFVLAFDSAYKPDLYRHYMSLNPDTFFYMNATEHLRDRTFRAGKDKDNSLIYYMGGRGMEPHYRTIRHYFYPLMRKVTRN